MSNHAITCDCSKCYPPGTPRPAWLSTFNPAEFAPVLLYGAAPSDSFDWRQWEPVIPPPRNEWCGVPSCHVCSGAMRERSAKGDP